MTDWPKFSNENKAKNAVSLTSRLGYPVDIVDAGQSSRKRQSTRRHEVLLQHDRAAFWGFCKRAAGNARGRARRAGVPCEIDAFLIDRLLVEQQWRCAVSGIALTAPRPQGAGIHSRDSFGPSIDRIIPDAGYVPGNVRVVCTMVNMAMSEWGADALFALCDAIRKRPRLPPPVLPAWEGDGMSEHTPGPWIVGAGGYRVYGPDPNRPSGRFVASAASEPIQYLSAERQKVVEANAHLIAAAPDLLEALRQCASWLASDGGMTFKHPILKAARAAINAARPSGTEG